MASNYNELYVQKWQPTFMVCSLRSLKARRLQKLKHRYYVHRYKFRLRMCMSKCVCVCLYIHTHAVWVSFYAHITTVAWYPYRYMKEEDNIIDRMIHCKPHGLFIMYIYSIYWCIYDVTHWLYLFFGFQSICSFVLGLNFEYAKSYIHTHSVDWLPFVVLFFLYSLQNLNFKVLLKTAIYSTKTKWKCICMFAD